MTDRNDRTATDWHPAEGVRLIGAEEAQSAVDSGRAAGRRSPAGSPATPPPVRLFTTEAAIGPDGGEPASARDVDDDDADGAIDLTDGYLRAQEQGRETRSTRAMALTASPPAPPASELAPGDLAPSIVAPPGRRLVSWGPPLPGAPTDGELSDREQSDREQVDRSSGESAVRVPSEEHGDTDAFSYPQPPPSGYVDDTVARRDGAAPEARLTVTGGHVLPHWTEPGEDGATALGSVPGGRETRPHVGSWARWRSDQRDWDDLDVGTDLFPDEDEPKLGALDTDRSERSDLYSFDEAFRQLQEERSGSHPAVSLDPEEVPLTDEPGAGGTPERPRPPSSRRPLRPAGQPVAGAAAAGGAAAPSGRAPGRLRWAAYRRRGGGSPDPTTGTTGAIGTAGATGTTGTDRGGRGAARAPSGESAAGATRHASPPPAS